MSATVHITGDLAVGPDGFLLLTDSEQARVSLVQDALVVDNTLGRVTIKGGYTLQAEDGLTVNGYTIPSAPLPYQSAPTAESLRDALVAAGYMAAEET